MSYNKVLIVSDNHFLVRSFKMLVRELHLPEEHFQYCCTSGKMELESEDLRKVDIKKEYRKVIDNFDLVISLHCKQIFPRELVNEIKCVNVHPGLNPFNRGWYPQVFSIINKLPIGATIHEMDELIDHGKIIAQQQVPVNSWDTSLDVYNRVLEAEIELLRKNLSRILEDNYIPTSPQQEGNYNSIDDFNRLLEIDLNKKKLTSELIDELRALTHGEFRNAYFIDPTTGKKVFVKLKLDPE
jgi:methionyl-tRNA formyltransferase